MGDQTGVLNPSFSTVPDLFEDITLPDRQAVVWRRPTRSFNRWAVTPLHMGSLLLHKQLLLIKTTSRLCLCRRGLLVDDPPSVQAEVGRREGAHRRWPDSRQRVHRTIPGRNETCSVSRDPPRLSMTHKKALFKVCYQTENSARRQFKKKNCNTLRFIWKEYFVNPSSLTL